MRWVSAYAVALFGAAMALMAWRDPAVYPPAIELGHFLLVATMVPAVGAAGRRGWRACASARGAQRAELAQALARIQELATRDELTGLINRRHMQALMEQEHQRCVRSGPELLRGDVRHRPLQADQRRARLRRRRRRAARGRAARRCATSASSDVLARWGGEEFVLLMSDTRAALARGGVERLQQRVAALRIAARRRRRCASPGRPAWPSTIAGETVAQTLERAERASARRQGAGPRPHSWSAPDAAAVRAR